VAWVGQGAISDRTKEHLGVSDRGVILYRRKLQEELKSLAEGGVPKGLITDPQRNCRVPLPGTLREVHMNGLPRDELLSHPFLGGLFRFGYPFQSGEPAELRAAFEDAMCLNPGWDSHLQAQDAAE
jgi:5,5'-dehydrodivanillate O-demethylase